MTPFALVLAGGRGTRFWPLSRRRRPKQCLSLDGGPSLLQRTIARIAPLVPIERVLVLTGPDMEEEVRAHSGAATVLVEPSPRNTLPAIAWGAAEAARRGGDALIVLPSDHLVADEDAFRAALHEALGLGDSLVTLGIRPTRAETAFGWIQPGRRSDDLGRPAGTDLPVRRFVEKPPATVAASMFAEGRCLWNAGIFVFSVDTFLRELATHAPATAAAVHAGEWAATDATSIDYGLMERAENVRVIPVDCGWSDVGSWNALADVLPAEEWGAGFAAAVVSERAVRNIVHAEGKLVALLGVSDLVIVDTPDALLVARSDDAQAVRNILARVERDAQGRHT